MYRYLFHDPNPKEDICNNIDVEYFDINKESLKTNKSNLRQLHADKFYKLDLPENYTETFPKGAKFSETDIDYCISLIEEECSEHQRQKEIEKAKRDKEAIKNLISNVDKTTLLSLLQEILEDDK